MTKPNDRESGITVRAGNHLVIPAGSIRMSIQPGAGNVRFSRPGIRWYAKFLFCEGQAENPEGLAALLDLYESQASAVVDQSRLLEDVDPDSESSIEMARERIMADIYAPEWWALATLKAVGAVRDAVAQEDVRRTGWAMNTLTNAHSMLVFLGHLEEAVWTGYSIEKLRLALAEWQDNRSNPKEEFWQDTLLQNAFVLSQLFSYPVIVGRGKAYLGGKGIENTGGNVVDFLMRHSLSENVALIEIKTPTTKLLGQKYRDGVYSISRDLSGAVVQISSYRDSLLKNYIALRQEAAGSFCAFNPQCLVIAGWRQDELVDEARVKSFELFRGSVRDTQIITYDELFAKLGILIDLLSGGSKE